MLTRPSQARSPKRNQMFAADQATKRAATAVTRRQHSQGRPWANLQAGAIKPKSLTTCMQVLQVLSRCLAAVVLQESLGIREKIAQMVLDDVERDR
jgi:hypothetical protein